MLLNRILTLARRFLPARSSTAAQLYLDIQALQQAFSKELASRELLFAQSIKYESVQAALRSWISAIELSQGEAHAAWLDGRDTLVRSLSRVESSLIDLHSDLGLLNGHLNGAIERLAALEEASGRALEHEKKMTGQVGSIVRQLSEVREGAIPRVESSLVGLQSGLASINTHVNEASQRLEASESERFRALEREETVLARVSNIALQLGEVSDALKWMRDAVSNVSVLEGRVTTLSSRCAGEAAQAPNQREWFERFYIEFENRYRGSIEGITERQAFYLPYIETLASSWGARPEDLMIADLGCGRGEWLQLLVSKGFTRAQGVDTNQAMLKYCREQSLLVEEKDAVSFLRSQPDDSFAVISAMHVVEHLPFFALVELLTEARRVLRPTGIIILETPNCENVIVATRGFHMDPTHKAPLPPLLLSFLCEHMGFRDVQTVRLHAYPESRGVQSSDQISREFNSFFFGAQDYAIIAVVP